MICAFFCTIVSFSSGTVIAWLYNLDPSDSPGLIFQRKGFINQFTAGAAGTAAAAAGTALILFYFILIQTCELWKENFLFLNFFFKIEFYSKQM